MKEQSKKDKIISPIENFIKNYLKTMDLRNQTIYHHRFKKSCPNPKKQQRLQQIFVSTKNKPQPNLFQVSSKPSTKGIILLDLGKSKLPRSSWKQSQARLYIREAHVSFVPTRQQRLMALQIVDDEQREPKWLSLFVIT